MKKIFLFIIISFFVGFRCFTFDLNAQIGERTMITDERPKFTDRLWFGGNFDLGFTTSYYNGGTVRANFFTIGLTPMVGYKFNNWFSMGPRVGVQFNNIKFIFPNMSESQSVFTEVLAGFARAKVFENFFGHFEYGIASLLYQTSGTLDIQKDYVERAFIGAGYTSGGKFATEIMILYDLILDDRFFNLPFDIRFGITYNF